MSSPGREEFGRGAPPAPQRPLHQPVPAFRRVLACERKGPDRPGEGVVVCRSCGSLDAAIPPRQVRRELRVSRYRSTYVEELAGTTPVAMLPGAPQSLNAMRGPGNGEIAAHHAERLDRTEAALGPEPRSGYEVSHDLFGRSLPPIQRRFAVAETLSHLERLVVEGRAARTGDRRLVTYTAP